MEDHAPGHLDDFELFRAHAQGGSAVGRNCAQSLPCTPETSWRSRGRRGVGHSTPGGGGKLSLQRADNFEIATNDEPVFYEYVNSLQQKQQHSSSSSNSRIGTIGDLGAVRRVGAPRSVSRYGSRRRGGRLSATRRDLSHCGTTAPTPPLARLRRPPRQPRPSLHRRSHLPPPRDNVSSTGVRSPRSVGR